jgi:sec-independent protein translocase protein TatB
MFDLGWTELLVVGVVALIVVGPKDLPILFRRVGQFVGKAKGMAREFSTAMNDAADESGMREMSSNLNKSLKAATNPMGAAMDGVKSAAKSLTDLDPESETGKLATQRAEDVKKIQASTARAAAERKQREAAEALVKADAAEAALAPAAKKPAAKKAAPKKAPAKKPVAKKPAAKKPAAKKAPAKKSST